MTKMGGEGDGVGVILKEDYIKRVIQVKRVSDRMMYMDSGGSTTGPLGPGPQAPELQGLPNSQQTIL